MIHLAIKPTDQEIVDAYRTAGSVYVAAAALGVAHSTVHRRLVKLGHDRSRKHYTKADMERLQRDYEAYVNSGRLAKLASEMGRTRACLCRQAQKLGLTKIGRAKQPQVAEMLLGHVVARNASGRHPRGMRGKKHSQETREKFSEIVIARWQNMSEDERSALTLASMKGRLEKHGTLAGNVKRGSWKAGWREVGDKRHFFRSRWEPNYARYLEWLKLNGKISDWQYEPKTFWFDAIKRGVRSYKPDFLVIETNGNSAWHEVKGWMDDRSKTTLKRMAKYHPSEKIILIDRKQYLAIEATMSRILPDWEMPDARK